MSVYSGQGQQEVKVGRKEQKFSESRASQGLGTSSERITSTFSLDLYEFVYFNTQYSTYCVLGTVLGALHIILLI